MHGVVMASRRVACDPLLTCGLTSGSGSHATRSSGRHALATRACSSLSAHVIKHAHVHVTCAGMRATRHGKRATYLRTLYSDRNILLGPTTRLLREDEGVEVVLVGSGGGLQPDGLVLVADACVGNEGAGEHGIEQLEHLMGVDCDVKIGERSRGSCLCGSTCSGASGCGSVHVAGGCLGDARVCFRGGGKSTGAHTADSSFAAPEQYCITSVRLSLQPQCGRMPAKCRMKSPSQY